MAGNQGGKPMYFPSTHWSLVAQAAGNPGWVGGEGLDRLLVRYLPPLRAHLVYRKGIAPDRADDLIQEFVACKVLEKGLIGQADRQLGKFRTFLLTALDRFVANRFRDERAMKRAPRDGRLVAIDENAMAMQGHHDPSDAYDVAWARETIGVALDRMRAECETTGRADVWGLFECRVIAPILEGAESIDYRELVERFRLQSPQQAANLLITAKRMYARILRTVVGEYARDDQEVDAEIAELREALCHATT